MNEQLRRAGEDVDDPADAWWERHYWDRELEGPRQLARRIIWQAHTLEDRVMTSDEREQFTKLHAAFVDRLNVIAGRARTAATRSRLTVAEARAELEQFRRASEAPPPRPRRGRARWAVCVHEAGHAIAALARDGLRSVSTRECTPVNRWDPVVLLAGAAAARFAGYPEQAELSTEDAALLRASLEQSGMGAWLPGFRSDADALLRANWPAVRAVAAALDRRDTLTGVEVAALAREAMRRAAPAHQPNRALAPAWLAPAFGL
ncbi:MAG: hypothetical protein AB7R55_13025 [Gemmatimonadales bacterium]